MRLISSLVAACAVMAALTLSSLAANNHPPRAAAKTGAHGQGAIAAPQRAGVVLRQDLFDRANPNNVRADWPAPPAQPAQY